MQNVGPKESSEPIKDTKSADEGQTSLTSSSAIMEKDQLLPVHQNFVELSEDEVSEDELEDAEPVLEAAKFLLPPAMEGMDAADLRTVDPETQARLEALLEAAGLGKLSTPDGKAFADPEVLRRLTSSVSCALDEAAQALTRMRAEQQGQVSQQADTSMRSLAEACSDGDIGTVRKLLDEGRSVHETTEEGESLLSLACSAGYYELAQVLLAMRANVEDRGIKGDCTPLMEAASGGHVDIVKLLITQGADVNAQSSAGNTPLHYAACGGYTDVVKVLIEGNANVEEHNENGHTPLMEAASAGHVAVAELLLKAGAGINTHSNEFKESALTLACYKGHLEMVKFLLEAGADQEHKTDEMHTALMEASMDGHVEVARLLLDSGAQVNMPADSFESPLTLAACGGHVELASLLIVRGANLEEVNDEGYTPLMEAAREGHEEMVALLLAHGAKINAQTEETQETALTLACCGGFLEVADFLIKAGADIELGCSTPLMEAAQEGHLDLVKYLIKQAALVNAQTGTGDTALTYACENGHTDVADILLQEEAELEHESEGGRTPLMKAARAGHLCTVQFLITKGADVNRQTSTNDHTVLSLACAGGHLSVVELLLNHGADPAHKLKDGSTMLIEAAKGGHVAVVNLLLDWPNTMMSANPEMQIPSLDSVVVDLPRVPMQGLNNVVPPNDPDNIPCVTNNFVENLQPDVNYLNPDIIHQNIQKSLTWHKPKENDADKKSSNNEALEPEPDFGYEYEKGFTESGESLPLDLDLKTNEKCEKLEAFISNMMRKAEMLNTTREEQIQKKQQILEELQKVERELQEKAQAQFCQGFQQNLDQPLPQPFQLQHLPFPQQFMSSTTTSPTPHFTFGQPVTLTDTGHIIVPGSSPESPQPTCKEFLPPDGEERLSDWSGSAGHSPESPPTTTSPSSGPTMGVPIQAREKKKAKRSIKFQQQTQQHQLQLTSTQAAQSVQPSIPATMTSTNSANEATLPATACPGEGPAAVESSVDPEAGVAEGVASYHKPDTAEVPAKPDVEHSSRASSEEVDISSVVPLEAAATSKVQPEEPQSPQSPPRQKITRSGEKKLKLNDDAPVSVASNQVDRICASVDAATLGAATLAEMPNLPLQTMLEQSVAAATSAAATLLDQQYQQLQQERQQLQANYTLQQHVQAELQQLKLQQEYQQLQQQLKAQQVLAQQLDLQSKAKDNKTQGTQQGVVKQPTVSQAHQLALQQLQVQQKLQQQVVASQTTVTVAPAVTTTTPSPAIQAQQYYKLQQELQQQPQLSLPQIQQQMEQQLQHLHKVQQLTQQKSNNQQVTQQELLQQAQQLQQQLQQVQHLQELAQQQLGQQQKQLATFQTGQQKKAKKKPATTTTNGSQPAAPQPAVTQAVPRPQTQPPPPQQTVITSTAATMVANNTFTYTTPMNQDTITPPSSTPLTPNPSPASPDASPPVYPNMELDAQTESNHDTALTLACAGGHAELVTLLLSRGADMEHRDKKGFTPLILAATAGHSDVVEILLDNGADIEAQSERTKDTPLSLACSGGRYEVVELLLARGANKEHRNVSDYTPLSLAASGGYVNIIKLLLSHGAEINSRTGSKLGISPLMLAAMNGHTQAVKLLLDMGSDINAQIETNRNTALTLACFQGRHEVVSLLVDRRANNEHRAKTGLTPLMEAASGGYVEVGRVLLDKGADVNAPPVPSSRDTALTIAADKGHYRFVELLLSRGAAVDVKNKKGNSPLWLACNGGHLDVVQLLVNAKADVDSQDNRKVSCLMAAFRKGHVKVVKWLVKHVSQFPSDNECMRFISTCTDKELLKKCHQCMEIIVSAKDRQAAEANKNASILLEELDKEKSREESKKAALARKRERRRRKKKEKQEKEKGKQDKCDDDEKTPSPEPEDKADRNKRSSKDDEEDDDDDEDDDEEDAPSGPPSATTTSTTGTNLSRETKQMSNKNQPQLQHQQVYSSNNNVEKRENQVNVSQANSHSSQASKVGKSRRKQRMERGADRGATNRSIEQPPVPSSYQNPVSLLSAPSQAPSIHSTSRRKPTTLNSGINDLDDFGVIPTPKIKMSPREKDKNQRNSVSKSKSHNLEMFGAPVSPGKAGNIKAGSLASPKRPQKKDEEWKEVTRKSEFSRTKKVAVPLNAVSRVIGRAGCNINAIREASGAHIEMDKQKGQAERTITIKGSAEAMRYAQTLIMALIKDPDKQIDQLIPKNKQKPAGLTSSSTNTFSSNMWHNSMALGVPASTNTGTIFTAQTCIMTASQRPQSVGKSGLPSHSSSSPITNGPLGGPSIGQTPFANVVKNSSSQPVNGHGPQPTTVASLSQQTNHSPSPKRSSKTSNTNSQSAASNTQPSQPAVNPSPKSNSAVARQLFPESSAQVAATGTKTTVTYSMASITKSKTVTSTTPTFTVKSEAKVPVMSSKVQPSIGPSSIAQTVSKQEPQPLPIMSSSGRPVSAPIPSSQPPNNNVTAVYSPFNNHFSRVAESMLSKKEESLESRKNFASVAAAGVVSSASQVTPPIIDTMMTKAPGYKSSHTNNHQSEPDLSKAPGYRSQAPAPGAPNGPLMDQTNFIHRHSVSTNDGEADPSKAPGYKGNHAMFGMMMEDYNRSPFKLNQLNHSMSPRSGHGGSPRSMDPGHSPPQLRNEYSTPNHPMTLPKIESTLNPNAPDFTSRSLQQQHQLYLQHQQQQRMLSTYQSLLQASALNPQAMTLLQAEFPPPGAPGLGSFGNAGLPLTSVAGNSPLPRQASPMAPSNQHQQPPPVSAPSKDESPASALSQEASPNSSSAPSPTDTNLAPGGERRPLPIGSGRTQKKPVTPSYGGMGEAGGNRFWPPFNNLGDWNSAVSTSLTSTANTAGLGDSDERTVHQVMINPQLLALSDPIIDQQLEPALQGQAVLLASSAGPLPFANGLPPQVSVPAAAAGLHHLYSAQMMPAASGDTVPPQSWPQQHKQHISELGPDPKIMWNNWNSPGSM